MISSPSISSHATRADRRDIQRDRIVQIRSRILATLEDAGRAMTPAEIARRTGLGACAVSLSANHWRRYFAVELGDDGKRINTIDRHHHLKTGTAS
jgi:hypothetical protein